jgi:MraZ protein
VVASGRQVVEFMFMGEYNHSIDTKGRIIIPSKFREALGDEFVVTQGLDGCLFVYPNDEWMNFVTQLKNLPGSKEARQLQRYFMAGAATCEVDKQGRILIPNKLREQAGLEKDIVFVGVLSKIEIWSKEKWENNNDYDDMDQIAEHMSEFGLSF